MTIRDKNDEDINKDNHNNTTEEEERRGRR